MEKMKLDDAIRVLAEMQKWRRAQPPYDGDIPETYRKMPYSAETFGHAIDFAIGFMEVIKEFSQQEKAK